jgi:hypothetical protein
MNDDTASALRSIVERLEAVGIEYMIVGSIAGLAHGRTRATQDFDVVIEVDRARLSELLASLPASRFYASEDAARDERPEHPVAGARAVSRARRWPRAPRSHTPSLTPPRAQPSLPA